MPALGANSMMPSTTVRCAPVSAAYSVPGAGTPAAPHWAAVMSTEKLPEKAAIQVSRGTAA